MTAERQIGAQQRPQERHRQRFVKPFEDFGKFAPGRPDIGREHEAEHAAQPVNAAPQARRRKVEGIQAAEEEPDAKGQERGSA